MCRIVRIDCLFLGHLKQTLTFILSPTTLTLAIELKNKTEFALATATLGKTDKSLSAEGCKCVQWTCDLVAFWNSCIDDGEQVCDQTESVAVFKVNLEHQDGQKMAMRWSRSAISLWLSGINLAITCNMFVIMCQLKCYKWWKSQIACLLLQICRLYTQK